MTALTLGWDSKDYINTTGRFAGLVYFVIKKYWGGDRISIIATEEWADMDESNQFFKDNKDVTKKYYNELMEECPENKW